MHDAHQMVMLTQTKPIAAVLFKYAWHFSGHHAWHHALYFYPIMHDGDDQWDGMHV